MSEKIDPESLLPSTTYTEAVHETLRNIASLVPTLGGPIANFFGGIAAGRKFERIREVLVNLTQDLADFKDQLSEEYVKSEDFEDLLEETLRRVARERHAEKRQMYRHFLSEEVKAPLDYDSQLQVLRTLDELQLPDLAALWAIFKEPQKEESNGLVAGSIIGTFRRRLPGTDDRVIEAAVDRLDRLRITDNLSQTLKVMMSPHGARDLRVRLTDFGRSLMKYLQSSG